MKQVLTKNVEYGRYVTKIDTEEWEFVKHEYPNAIFDKKRNQYLHLEDEYFDKSDLGQLLMEIDDKEIFHLESINFEADYQCFYNNVTKEYIGVLVAKNDQ